jgi:hypothetical protein
MPLLLNSPLPNPPRRGEGIFFSPFNFILLAEFLFFSTSALAASSAVDPALCRTVTQHTPKADVAYQSGVDVHGKPVASADLPDSPQMQLPDQVKIPLTFDLAKTLNLDTSAYPYNQFGKGTEVQLGELTVEGSTVMFNGKPITSAQQERLAVLCLKAK